MRTALCFFSFLFITITYNSAQSNGWFKSFSGSSVESSENIALDIYGNSYITGQFSGTEDFDPGPGVYNLTAFAADIFILKLDKHGEFLWAKKIGYLWDDGGLGITVDHEGNLYATGFFRDEVDFDPGIGTYIINSDGYDDIYILKLNAAGEFIWAKGLTGPGTLNGRAFVTIGPDNNVYIGGDVIGTIDFDPGIETHNIIAGGSVCDVYLAKYDPEGNYIWAHNFGDSYSDYLNSIYISSTNEVYATGQFYFTPDFDPGPEVFSLTSIGDQDIFILKLDTDGNFKWVKQIGEPAYDSGVSIRQDADGNSYITGSFRGTADFDPGSGTHTLTSAGDFDTYVLKLDIDGEYVWAKRIGGPGTDENYTMDMDDAANMYVLGSYAGEVDFDPDFGIHTMEEGSYAHSYYLLKLNADGNFVRVNMMESEYNMTPADIMSQGQNIFITGHFAGEFHLLFGSDTITANSMVGGDVFVLKISQDSCSNLTLLIDSATSELSCITGLAGTSVHAIEGKDPYAYAWNTIPVTEDASAIFNSTGIYEVQVTDGNGCEQNMSILIGGPEFLSEQDMSTNLVTTDFRPGFKSNIWVNVFNSGCEAATGYMQLILDTLLVYSGADPTPDYIAGDTLRWNFTGIRYDSSAAAPHVFVTTPVTALAGYPVHLQANCISAGETDTTNNKQDVDENVITSYDPNDIKVSPEGICEAGYILNNQLLTYSIRFQNTGSADAVNIYVMDTLSALCNIETVKIIAKSHAMYTEVLPGNVLKFVFNDIHLPDSTSNEPESHGYVSFEVSLLEDVPAFSEVSNTASIYFDYNYPVLTNMVVNTVIHEIPVSASEQYITICAGESVNIGGNTYSETGVYTNLLPSFYGCDSTVTTHLAVNETYEAEQTVLLCAGESISVGGNHYTESGIYTDVLTGIAGCDSTIITDLTVNPVYYDTTEASVCAGEIYIFNSVELSEAGLYSLSYISEAGCDSVITLSLTVTTVNNSVTQTATELTADLPGALYQWINCSDNSWIPDATAQTFKPENTGSYAVIINDNGCTDTSLCYFADVLDIADNNALSPVTIFPNPAKDDLSLLFENMPADITIRVFTLQGQEIYTPSFITGKTIRIDLETTITGVYILQLSNASSCMRFSFVKQN